MRAWDCDFIVARCLLLAQSLDITWENTCHEVVNEEIKDLTERQASLRAAFDKTIEVLSIAAEGAGAFADKTGLVVEKLDELTRVKEEMERKREKYLLRFSLLDDEIIKAAIAEHAAGNYVNAAQALADLLAGTARRANHTQVCGASRLGIIEKAKTYVEKPQPPPK